MKKHSLSEYIGLLSRKGLLVDTDIDRDSTKEIECLTYFTGEVAKNALFVCKGAHFKEEYLEFAMANGAIAYVSETKYPSVASYIIVSDVRRAMVELALEFYNDAPSRVTSVGITGTKGKSTTAYYVRAILNDWFKREGRPECAIISSIDTYDGVIREESHITTPEAIELHRHFNNAESSGISHLVMEVSSQALKYGRVLGIELDVACFTNIGCDHISPIEHTDFEDYFKSKLKIFDSCKCACINTDADLSDRILAYADGKCRIVTFGSHESDTVYCSGIEKRGEDTVFHVKTPDYEGEMKITMPGLFNVSNALAAIAICHVLGVPIEHVKSGLARARAGGRMQVYKSRDGKIVVIVDYAHNEMSFDALFSSVRIEYPDRDIVSVFGCPGGKAQLRRHDLGKIAGKNADYIIITEEDSGEEPFSSIAKDIAANIENCDYTVIEDRGEAIRKAILEYRAPKKIVLLTGKGEETRQKRGTAYVDCPSDVDHTLKFLKEYDSSADAD